MYLFETTKLTGNVLNLNPSSLGDFSSASLAINAIPDGGTLHLINTYDASIHGKITLKRPISIKGNGYGKTIDGKYVGTKILNTVSPLPSVIEFDGDGVGMHNTVMEDILIEHNGDDYAMKIKSMAFGEYNNVLINCNYIGKGGVRVLDGDSSSFWHVLRRVRIRNFTHSGVWFDSPRGSKNELWNCHIQSNHPSAIAGVILSTKDTLIHSGQINVINGPSVLLMPTTYYGNDLVGNVIDSVLSEKNQPIVEFGMQDEHLTVTGTTGKGTGSIVLSNTHGHNKNKMAGTLATITGGTFDNGTYRVLLNDKLGNSLTLTDKDGYPVSFKGESVSIDFHLNPVHLKSVQCVVRNPVTNMVGAEATNKKFVVFNYAKDCLLERPLPYGDDPIGTSGAKGQICEFTENAFNNTVILQGGFWASLGITDSSSYKNGNRIILDNASAPEIIRAQLSWPINSRQEVYSHILESTMQRNRKSSLDGYIGKWEPVNRKFKDINAYPDIVLHLSADDMASMYQDKDAMNIIKKSGDKVLSWKDSSRGHIFSVKERILTIEPGYPTIIKSHKGHSVNAGDEITISDVIVNSGANINNTFTVLDDLEACKFSIDFDSTGSSYRVNVTSYFVNILNAPEYQENVLERGLPGIYFDGVNEHLIGPAISLDSLGACYLVVVTPDIYRADKTHRYICGRNWGADGVRVHNTESSVRFIATVNSTHIGPVKSGAKPDDKATVIFFANADGDNLTGKAGYWKNEAISSPLSYESSDSDSEEWQVAGSGNTNHTGSAGLWRGWVHELIYFRSVPTDEFLEELNFYMCLKYNINT